MTLWTSTLRAPWRRMAPLLAMAALVVALQGCLVSEKRVDLGPRAQPLPPGLYVSFNDDGAPDHAVVVRIAKDGRYVGEDFDVALYQSGIAPDVYFVSHFDAEEDQTLYGVARVGENALVYPGVVCDMVPAEALSAAKLGQHENGCLIDAPEQGRTVLTALWRSLPGKDDPTPEGWTRFVLQTDFQR